MRYDRERDEFSHITTADGLVTRDFSGALVSAAIFLVWLVLQLRTRAFRRQTRVLEQQVAERTAALHQVNQKLCEASAFKHPFFSILAHDLRSPITGLRSVVEPVVKPFSDFTGCELGTAGDRCVRAGDRGVGRLAGDGTLKVDRAWQRLPGRRGGVG